MPEVAAVTTQQMWGATLGAAALALTLGALLSRRVREPFPAHLSTALLWVGLVWFMGLYGWAAWTFWDTCYGAIFPPWVRVAAPVVGIVDALLGWAFWRMARRISPARPTAPFLALGSLLSVPGHLHGIYARGLLEKCAVVRGITPASALAFGLFEFAIYWAIVLFVAHTFATHSPGVGKREGPPSR